MKAPAQNNRAVEKSSPEAHVIAERGAHHRVWRRERLVTLPDGRTVNRPTGFTELATGLHYFENGAWRETREEIVITPSGATAIQGPHRVQFTGNLNTHGAITLTAPDGKTLRSHVLGLAYTDTTTGESVFLGLIRDTEGVLHPPNEVVYPNAFSGVRADVRYIYTRQGFEQDVILRASLPTPESLGMKAETTLLEVWTEFVESPEPVIKLVPGPGSRTADQALEFGSVRILRGHAFALDAPLNRMSAAPVVKQWVQAGTQRYLIESVRYSTILPELEKLPPHQAGLKLPAHEKNSRLALLQQIKPLETRPATPVRLALPNQPFQRHQGLVLDYVLYQGDRTNVTFQADTTYLLTDWFNVYGTATFEGGTVLKYNTTNNLILSVYDDVVCATEPYRPAIFTSRNDRTVGEDVYDGTPMQFHGAIAVATPGVEFKHLRISYAWRGLQTYGVKARHMQFGHCDTAFATFYTLFEEWGAAEFENVLIHDTRVAFGGAIYSNVVHHATVRACDLLTDDIYGYTSELYLTNSLLVNVTNWGVSGYFTNATVQTTNAAALRTVGAGAHYLADGSPYRNVGTTNLPAALAAELRRRTTRPPLVWSNVTLTTNLTLLPVVARGGSVPDLGYYYAPLDYAMRRLVISNATLTLAGGVAVAGYATNSAYEFMAVCAQGGGFLSSGSPTNLNRLVAHNSVQEQAGEGWAQVAALLLTPYWNTATPMQGIRCRFTEFSAPGAGMLYLQTYDNAGTVPRVALQDCQFHGGRLYANSLFNSSRLALTNNLFHRVESIAWVDAGDVFNNTFVGGSLDFIFYDAGTLADNLFDATGIYQVFDLTNRHNGYTTNLSRLIPNATNDTVVTNVNLAYDSGLLGKFYLPTNSAFTNRGSRSAGTAGLYWFTTARSQKPETNSTVDLGFHYLALSSTNANAAVPDTDGDGVVDYVEDANGNGTQDVGETSLTRQDSPFLPRDYEPLGPSSRRTPLVISEIMYHTASGGTEFIELYNTHHLPQKLDGFTLVNVNANNLVIYTFTNFTLAPGAFHHVTPVFSLPEASTKVQLRNNRGAVLLEVKYSPKTPWPAEANGAGHSLVLARPSYGENDPRAWVASEKRGGSPGYAETNHVDFLRTVKINEFLAATAPFIDAIELYNAGNQPIDISGCYLARNPSNLTEYAIPAGTILQPRGFVDFSLLDFPGFNINLNQTGDAIYLTNPDQTRVLDAVAFEDQEASVSTGRSPDGAPNLVRQAAYSLFGPTFTNGPARSEQIVINEIMFNPVSGNIFASSSNSTIQAPIP